MGSKAIYTSRKLTDEERAFAEAHHDLMYRYMKIHNLKIEDWYDILIIPYLQAVKKYHEYEKLQSLKFEQVFFRTLDSARSNYWRDINRKKRCPAGGIWSLEGLHSDSYLYEGESNFIEIIIDQTARHIDDIITDKVYAENLLNQIEEEMLKEIVCMRISGYSSGEICNNLDISYKEYARSIKKVRDMILEWTR